MRTELRTEIERLLADGDNIYITSGEGDLGTTEEYGGKRTLAAIKARVRKERADGDRWATAKIYSHQTADESCVYLDIMAGEYCG